jgi:hypothetical protein
MSFTFNNDTASPSLLYPEPPPTITGTPEPPASYPYPCANRAGTPYYNAGSELNYDSNKENRKCFIYNLTPSNFAFTYIHARVANLYFGMIQGWPLGLRWVAYDIIDIAYIV